MDKVYAYLIQKNDDFKTVLIVANSEKKSRQEAQAKGWKIVNVQEDGEMIADLKELAESATIE